MGKIKNRFGVTKPDFTYQKFSRHDRFPLRDLPIAEQDRDTHRCKESQVFTLQYFFIDPVRNRFVVAPKVKIRLSLINDSI